MKSFKHMVSKANTFYGWNFLSWLKGQKKTAITGMTILLVWSLVNNQLITMETAITLAGMTVAGLYAVIEFYFKEVELEE